MSQKIFIPKTAVVLVTGASCTGKSTLARKIIDAYPSNSKALVAADELMETYLRRHPEAGEEIQKSILRNQGVLKDAQYDQLLSEAFALALRTMDLVVSEGIYVKPEMVVSHIMAAASTRGPEHPFILIRMNPNESQHQRFYNAREEERRLAWKFVQDEKVFFQKVLETDYPRIFPWVAQYTVSDPTTAEVQFLA